MNRAKLLNSAVFGGTALTFTLVATSATLNTLIIDRPFEDRFLQNFPGKVLEREISVVDGPFACPVPPSNHISMAVDTDPTASIEKALDQAQLTYRRQDGYWNIERSASKPPFSSIWSTPTFISVSGDDSKKIIYIDFDLPEKNWLQLNLIDPVVRSVKSALPTTSDQTVTNI